VTGSINFKAIVTILFGISMGLYILIEVLNARTSSLGQLYMFVAIGAFVYGLTNPKQSIYVMLFMTVYIDVFKRMMVIGGNPTFVDVAYVLAAPPLLIAGCFISIFLAYTVGRKKITREIVLAMIVSALMVGLTVVGVAFSDESSGGLSGLSAIINQGFYSFLFVIIPSLFTTDEDRRKLLHFSFLTIIPAVFYTFWQKKFGYAQFEYDYLMSGLTIEAKNLIESVGGEFRCFSTFNGAGPASTMFSIYLLYCFVSLKPGNAAPSFFSRFGKWILAPFFVIAAYFTIIRTGWVGGVGSLLAFVLLGSKFRAYSGVFVAVLGFSTIVALAPTAIKNNWLGEIELTLQNTVGNFTTDSTVKRAIILGTAADRVQGWANLTQEPKIWQPFGFAASDMNGNNQSNKGSFWGHDAIIDALIKFGYIPLFLIFLMGSFMLMKIFQYMYSLDKRSQAFKNTRLCLALASGIMVGGLGHGATFRNFPQNFFFSMWLAIPFATYQQAMRERKNARQAKPSDAVVEETYPALAHASRVGMSGQ